MPTMGPLTRIYRSIARHVADHASTNLELALKLEARDSSARFINQHLSSAERFTSREDLLKAAAKRTEHLAGCICEFGVYKGYTLSLLADAAASRMVYGFDSFEGLPEDWRHGFATGAFRTPIPELDRANVKLIAGCFEQSLPTFLQGHDGDISLAHIDCDLYSSTRTVLQHVATRLQPGSLVVFDEYMNYPGWTQHEHKALIEAALEGLSFRYLAFNIQGEQVMIEITEKDQGLTALPTVF